MTPSKHALRKHYLSVRQNLTTEQQKIAAHKIRFIVGRHPWFKNAQKIAFYWPSGGEISPIPLLKFALKKNKSCYLPRILPHNKMQFHRYQTGDKLVRGTFNIYAPHRAKASASLKSMDLVILPLVAFDRRGARLGLGGGFYDRALQNTYRKPRRLGVAHHCQLAEAIPLDPWDVRLHGIATDQSFITC